MWEGVWPYLDPMDSVCLRTASMEWDVPGKYEPHGELLFSSDGDGFQLLELGDRMENRVPKESKVGE